MHTYDEMVTRIDNTPELEPYREVLVYDWPNEQEHIDWVCTAPVAEIVAWAREIEIEA